MAGIRFHSQDTSFKLSHPKLVIEWLTAVARKEKTAILSLDYIFCSDEFLLKINTDFLNHDEFTDIITFDYREPTALKEDLEGEIYISVDRVGENAKAFKTSFDDEIHRVMVHGVLHLCGFGDKTPAEKAEMRKKEDACLSLRQFHVKR